MRRALALLAAVLFSCSFAHASTIVYDVSATLEYGGTLSGTFTITNGSVTTFDLTATAGPGSPGFTFTGFGYGNSNASVTAETSTLIQIDSTPAGDELRLDFASALGSTTDAITGGSYESEIVAGNRTVTSGSVAPEIASAPEPSSLALLSTGALGLIGAARRKFRKA